MTSFQGLEDIPASEVMSRLLGGPISHCEELGIHVEAYDPPRLTMRLPYQEKLVADPESGVIHGGAVTTLVDTASGLISMAAARPPQAVATLDLRIDYLRPGMRGFDILCTAEAYRVTKLIVFVKAEALQAEDGRQIAAAMGTFMITGHPLGSEARL